MTVLRTVNTSVDGRIFTMVIDHPPVNAIDPQTLFELENAVEEFTTNPAYGIAVLASANLTVFVSGADVPALAGMVKNGKISEFILRGQALFKKISASPKPIVAAINGLALGGGLELAMACHLRIASERAKFGLPEINLGILPGWGGTQRLPHIVGRAKAVEMILLGETISAQEALRLNLVNKLVPRNEVLPTAMEIAHKVASKSGAAVNAAMESIRSAIETEREEGLAIETRQITALVETDDAQEKINAFIKKQNPAV